MDRPRNSKDLWAGCPALAQVVANLQHKGFSHQELQAVGKKIADVLQPASDGYFCRSKFEANIDRAYKAEFLGEVE